VPNDSHILKKFKGKPPSLIIHLHPTHFRFDQQDGSFSYQSEMRVFIEHLLKGTIPHDMIEEFRRSEVQFYDGWLIVRVFDHRTVSNSASSSNSAADDGKPFSIHNYNEYITPSPYAPYPSKEHTSQRSPQMKQGNSHSKDGPSSGARSDDTLAAPVRPGKARPKIYHVALRPTILSRHMDLVIDAMAPDPKALNRKQSQVNANNRGAAPPTPVSGVPSTPATEKGPPLKKQKMKIDAKDLLEYEARIVNATAPPLYLEAVDSFEDAQVVIEMLGDPHHDAAPPTAKSRKRTFAELAADDAHAKDQERFMLIMDERNAGNAPGANAGATDTQAGAGLFQPRFEKFNALDTIKRELAERKQREKERQLQDDENRRGLHERQAEDERKRMIAVQQQRQREQNQLKMRQQQEMQHQAHQAAQAQQAQAQALRQQQQQQQASSIPPQMQSQMMAGQQRSSPIIRQGTPHAASSPIVNSAPGGQAMTVSGSQQGAGSPQRPGSAVQHGHPGVAMTRGPSGQGPSRHGTPQIPHSTPGMRNATPIMRQGTPAQHMTQASPHGSMMAPTPQMSHAAAMQGQVAMPQHQYTPAQVTQIQQQRQAAMAQAAMHGRQMVNGTPQMQPAQAAQMHAQQSAMRVQQQQQHQAMQQQQSNPQTPQMVQSPAQGQAQYKQQMAEQMKAQMHSMQQGSNQGSPAPNQMTPQQQHAAQVAHQQQQQQQQRMMQQSQQQNRMMGNINQQNMQQQQQRPGQMPPQLQQLYQTALSTFQQRFLAHAAQKYNGNTGMLSQQELAQVNQLAAKHAMGEVQKRRQASAHQMQQQQVLRQQQAHNQAVQAQQQQQQGQMPNGMNMAAMQGHPNMQSALQQQQAQHMQQMQVQHAQQMLANAPHPQQPNQGGGSMASIQQYQQHLQQMTQQQQQRQG
jgi:transcription factor SPT20